MNAELHLHTDAYYNGIGDGAQTVIEAIDQASIRGSTAVAITDHGNCANWVDFFNYARGKEVDHQTLEKKGLKPVKPILGVEAYIAEKETLLEENNLREHLILLAKDYKGFQQIARFVSETNRHLDESGRPLGSFEMLEEFFGQDPGHVVCSSACIAGVLSTPLLYNNRIDKEVGKIERRVGKSEAALGAVYAKAKERVERANAEIQKRQARIDELTPVAKKTYSRITSSIKKEEDPVKRQLLTDSLTLEKAETELAKVEISSLKDEIKLIKSGVAEDRKELTKAKPKLQTIEQNYGLINALKDLYKTDEEMYQAAMQQAYRYKQLFGKDFYVELQYHHINEEAVVMPILKDIANTLDIECIITNDVHMASKDDLQKRNLLRNSANIKKPWNPAIPGDEELYFKTDKEKSAILSELFDKDFVDRAIANSNRIAEECNVTELSQANHYPEFEDATQHLRELAIEGKTKVKLPDGRFIEIASPNAGMQARYGQSWNKDLTDRFEYEMSVIDKMGFSSYFLYIADVINKCKTARDNATDIGPGRGSGAGSIVCYLAGITELDPIKYDLLFERFLNPSRVSMPKQYWAFDVNPITQGCVA